MSRRSRGRKDAQEKSVAPSTHRPGGGPTIRRSPGVDRGGRLALASSRVKKPWEEQCPVCHADIFEEGGTGCCNAMVAECEGSLDGVPIDWNTVDESDENEVQDRLVHHAWFLDDGTPAPSDYSPSVGPKNCRCGTPAH